MDFPTLGLPTILTKPDRCVTSCLSSIVRSMEGVGMKDLARPLPAKGRVAGKVYRMGRLVLGIVSPLDVDCTPGEACAEGREDEVVTLLELLLELPDAEGDRS